MTTKYTAKKDKFNYHLNGLIQFFNDDKKELILLAKRKGTPIQEIADALHVTPDAIHKFMRKGQA